MAKKNDPSQVLRLLRVINAETVRVSKEIAERVIRPSIKRDTRPLSVFGSRLHGLYLVTVKVRRAFYAKEKEVGVDTINLIRELFGCDRPTNELYLVELDYRCTDKDDPRVQFALAVQKIIGEDQLPLRFVYTEKS